MLLLKRATEPGFGQWGLPAGHYEPGENAEEGILREILEETGLIVDVRYVRSFGKIGTENKSYLSLLFHAKTDVDEVMLDDESSDWAWVDLCESTLSQIDWAFPNQKEAVLDVAKKC